MNNENLTGRPEVGQAEIDAKAYELSASLAQADAATNEALMKTDQETEAAKVSRRRAFDIEVASKRESERRRGYRNWSK